MSTPQNNPLSRYRLFLILPAILIGLGLSLWDDYRENGYVSELSIGVVIFMLTVMLVVSLVWYWLSNRNTPAERKADWTPWNDRPVFSYLAHLLMALILIVVVAQAVLFYDTITMKDGLVIALLVTLVGLSQAWYWGRGRHQMQSTTWAKQGRCTTCGYDLQQIGSDSCPECGAFIDRSLASTNNEISAQDMRDFVESPANRSASRRFFWLDLRPIGLAEFLKHGGCNPLFLIGWLLTRGRKTPQPGDYFSITGSITDSLIARDAVHADVLNRINEKANDATGLGFLEPVFVFAPSMVPSASSVTAFYLHNEGRYYLSVSVSVGRPSGIDEVSLVSRLSGGRYIVTSDMRKIHNLPDNRDEFVSPGSDLRTLCDMHIKRLLEYPDTVEAIKAQDSLILAADHMAQVMVDYMVGRGLYVEVSGDDILAHAESEAAPQP